MTRTTAFGRTAPRTSAPRVAAQRSERLAAAVVTGLALLVGGFFLWTSLASSEAGGSTSAARPVTFVVANAAAGGLLWWHRRFPVRVFVAILAVYVVSTLATGMLVSGGLRLPLWFGVFALAAYAPLRRACVAIIAGWVADTTVQVWLTIALGHPLTVGEVVLAFIADVGFFFIACSALGLGFRSQYQRAREATEHARLLKDHARALHAEAVATERNRLARDLHDLAAHELMDALLAVRALQVDHHDPELAEIEQKTSRALDNMRTVVRTLREDQSRSAPDRLGLAKAVAQLVDDLRDERGMTIDTTISPDLEVDDAVASTVLSVLTETVLNAARHAPGMPVIVTVDSTEGEVRLRIANPVGHTDSDSNEGTGYGLVGAEERCRLLNGTFDAGPTPDGTWVARLQLPRAAPTDDAPDARGAR